MAGRMVSADEARDWLEMPSDGSGLYEDFADELAHTVVELTAQLDAANARADAAERDRDFAREDQEGWMQQAQHLDNRLEFVADERDAAITRAYAAEAKVRAVEEVVVKVHGMGPGFSGLVLTGDLLAALATPEVQS